MSAPDTKPRFDLRRMDAAGWKILGLLLLGLFSATIALHWALGLLGFQMVLSTLYVIVSGVAALWVLHRRSRDLRHPRK